MEEITIPKNVDGTEVTVLYLGTPTAMFIVLIILEMESGVMEEITIPSSVDGMGGIVPPLMHFIPTAMWIILVGLEMDTVVEEITIPSSVDMMEVTAYDPRDR